jgi:hypothetical protein
MCIGCHSSNGKGLIAMIHEISSVVKLFTQRKRQLLHSVVMLLHLACFLTTNSFLIKLAKIKAEKM